jgi:glycosyltransferase involved in cell wall biosynthesis
MPEVLRVVARLNVGGPARHAIRIAAPLAARGWRTLLVTGTPAPGEGDLADEARAAGLELQRLPELGRALSPLRDFSAWRALRRIIEARQPAVVHTHTAKAGVVGRLAALRASPPARPALVHTYHGHVLDGYFARPVSAAFRGIEAGLARRTDRLVAVSRSVRDELLSRHLVGRPEQWVVIPPGVDFERTAPDRQAGGELRRALGVPDDGVLVGCVGRLAPIKRLDLACAAWAAAAPALPQAHWLVVGEGEGGPPLRARLAALPRAHWLPPRTALHEVYGALDALLLCSDAEGLPQTVVEALCAGLPVLATAVGGVPELVADEVNGLLVPRGDVAALSGALRRLLADARLRARLGRAAVMLDRAPHAAAAVGGRLADLYDELHRAALAGAPPTSQTSSACTSSS